jgi:hypothetical protein
MKTTIKGKTLFLEIPLQKPTLSKTGKSHIVASTGGFKPTTAMIDGKPLKIAVNAII